MSSQTIAGCSENCRGGGFGDFVPEGEELTIAQFDGGGITEVACAVVAQDEGCRPGLGIVFTEPNLIASRGAAVSIAHQQATIFKAEEMTGETPDAYGVWDSPGLSAIDGFGLQSLLCVGLVVIADVGNEGSVACLDGVKLVIIPG